jgi:hypothetical protein
VLACRSLPVFLPRGSGDAEATREARARAAGASYPMMLVSVKRLVRTSRPRITPPAGVHEGSVVVSFDCPPGVLVFLRLLLKTTTPLHLLHPSCCLCVCVHPAVCTPCALSVCSRYVTGYAPTPARKKVHTRTHAHTHARAHTHIHPHTCARARAGEETS